MMSKMRTPSSSARFLNSAKYFWDLAFFMKNWLTSSIASMPYSCLGIFGKSGWFIFLPKKGGLKDHSGGEIFKMGVGSSEKMGTVIPVPKRATADDVMKSRRLSDPII